MKEIDWFISEYRCANGVCVKTKFPAKGDESARPGTRRYERSVRRAEKGAYEARHELARKLNENFRAGQDVYLGMDYSTAGMERLICRAGTDERDPVYLSAAQEVRNYIRRCKRACDAEGVELRYVYVTSDLDGKTFEEVRVHHHMVVNREAAEICVRKWSAGGIWSKTLYGQKHGDLTHLADYMIGQVRSIEGTKRYTPSRNLRSVRPYTTRKARNPEAELRVPKGCEYIWRSESYAGRPQHLRYYRPGSAEKDDEEVEPDA